MLIKNDTVQYLLNHGANINQVTRLLKINNDPHWSKVNQNLLTSTEFTAVKKYKPDKYETLRDWYLDVNDGKDPRNILKVWPFECHICMVIKTHDDKHVLYHKDNSKPHFICKRCYRQLRNKRICPMCNGELGDCHIDYQYYPACSKAGL